MKEKLIYSMVEQKWASSGLEDQGADKWNEFFFSVSGGNYLKVSNFWYFVSRNVNLLLGHFLGKVII